MSSGMPNLEQFNRDIRKWCDEYVPRQARMLLQWMGFFCLRGMAMKTPKKEGRAAGGWIVEIGSPAEGETGRLDKTPRADIVFAEESPKVEAAQFNDIIWIVNNVPYIVRLDEGHSQQDKAMVARTLHEVMEAVEARLSGDQSFEGAPTI